MSRNRQEAILLGWLKALPEVLIRARPVLCNLYAGALTDRRNPGCGNLAGGCRTVAELDPRRARPTGYPAIGNGGGEPRGISPAAGRGRHAPRRICPGTRQCERNDPYKPAGRSSSHQRMTISGEEGQRRSRDLALWTIGDIETARQMYLDGIVSLQRAGYLADSIGVALALADIVIAQGHLHQAMSIYEEALRLAHTSTESPTCGEQPIC